MTEKDLAMLEKSRNVSRLSVRRRGLLARKKMGKK